MNLIPTLVLELVKFFVAGVGGGGLKAPPGWNWIKIMF